mgnify:CR=1 FL=1
MDKNSVTGIVLIMAMLLGYQYFFAPKEPIENPKAKIEDILISNSNPIVITPLSSGFDRLKNIDVYAVFDKDVVPDTVDGTFFGLLSGYYSVNFDYENFYFENNVNFR